MKIAIISTLFQKEEQMNSGYYPLLYDIVRKLSENIDITVFSSGWPKHPQKDIINNINVIRTASCGRSIGGLEFWPMCLHLRNILKKNYDIINGFGNDASILYYLLNKLNSKKTKITSSMSIICGWQSAVPYKLSLNSQLKMKAMGLYDGISIKNSDKIIALSNFAKNEILNSYHTSPEKIDIISPGIDTEIFKPAKVENSKYDNKTIIFYVGGTGYRKGYDILIAAYAELKKKYKDILLIISGSYSLERIQSTTKSTGLDIKKDIIFLGNVPHNKISYYFNLCDIYVHPSYHETFGVALLEAMACKKPVIACNTTAIPEALGNAGIYIKPGSVNDLTSKISSLIENPELRKKLGSRGRKRVLKNYTIDNTVNSYLRFYKHYDT